MPFKADPATLGVPDFGIIHIDPDQTAQAFQDYLRTASKLTGVSLDNIKTNLIELPADPRKATLADLVNKGMKLFDAVVWISAGRPVSHELKVDPAMKKESIPSMQDVARAVFYCYFMLLTQARYPVPRKESNKPKVPNFLRNIMGMQEEQSHYVELVCSFPPQQFDPAWAQYVSFKGFGREVLSRFGLGVAGYRMFGPFNLYQPKEDVDESLLPAFNFARNVARADPSWNIHPLTRDPNILGRRGNLNKNLGNLILDVFSEADIEEMAKSKVIFAKPEKNPTSREYLQWSAADDITGSKLIQFD